MNRRCLLLTIGLAGCLVWPALTLFRRPMPVAVNPGPATSARPGSGGKENASSTLRGAQGPEYLERPAVEKWQMAERDMSAWLASASARPLPEKHLGGRTPAFNQWLDSSFRSTTASAGIRDLMELVGARSTAGVEEPQGERDGAEGNETRADHPDEATKFRNLQLVDETGKIPLDGLQKAREQMNVMREAQQRRAKSEGKPDGIEVAGIDPGSWAWLGPGNIGGRIRSIVIDPVDPNKMWVGSVSGGIWKTTNAGGAWSPVNDFMANLAVSTMVIDPTNSNIMYAGTGESFNAQLGVTEGEGNGSNKTRGDGVFKSVDGGTIWTQLAQTNPSVPAICPNPATPGNCPWLYINRLAISPDGSTILAATLTGIYRSTDGGGTWNLVTGGARGYLDVDFDPTNSQNAVASGTGALPSIFSTNGGQNWQNSTYFPAITASGRIEITYAPSNPLIVYAAVNNNNGDIYRSFNGGQSFDQCNTGTNFFLGAGNQGEYDNTIWVNPQDETFIIVGGIDLWRSTDRGANFNQISQWQNAPASSAHADQHMIVASPAFNNTTNKTVYFSNDGGMYRADDVSTVSLTSGWVNLNNNLGITQFYGAAANSAGVIVGGAQDNGNSRFNGDPNSWRPITGMGGDGGYVAADPTDSNYFYGEYVNLQIRRSTDGGTSGGNIFSGISDAVCTPPPGGTCTPPANFIAPFVLDPNEPNRMLAGGLSLWRSNDVKNTAANPTWSKIKPPASNGLIPPTNIPISAITVSPNNPDFIVVGDNVGRIYLTLDGTGSNPVPDGQPCAPGNSPCWSRISNNLITPSRFVTRLVIDETRSPNWIYATFGGFSNNNVYVTKDLGSTWTDVSGVTGSATDLPSVPVRSLVINPVRGDYIYVGTEVGVFASQDAGATWHLPQDGPANVPVDQLFWLKGDLIAVTFGRGLFKTSTPIIASPLCVPPIPACSCFGEWNCPCSWNIQRVPTQNDDIAIECNMHLGPGVPGGVGQARNMRVDAVLTMDVDLAVTDNITNVGNIRRSTPDTLSNISCRSLSNARVPSRILAGDISLLGNIRAGNVNNYGLIALGGRLDANDLTVGADSTLTAGTIFITGNLQNSGRTEALALPSGSISVGGNVLNDGFLKASSLALNANLAGQYNFSGAGVWQFTSFGIPNINGNGGPAPTVSLGSDVTFDILNFSNNGKLDFRDKILNFTGNSFQGGGTALGTGTLRFAPASGNAVFNANGPAVTIASGTVEYQSGGTISGLFVISTGATFAMNTGGSLTANNNVTVNGTLSKIGFNPVFVFNGRTFINNGIVGDIDFFTFNDGAGLPVQFIAGTGSWSPRNIQIGTAGSPTTVNLNNSVAFATNQLVTAAGSTLNLGNFTLTMTGQTNFFAGKISGTGLVKVQPLSGSPRLGTPSGALTIDPALEIASGTVRATTLITNGKLTVDPGATLSLLGFVGVEARGDVENNGTLNAFSDNPSFKFKGGTFTNNGVVTGNVYVNFGDFFGPPLVQNLAGTGSWAGSPRLFFDSTSTTTLLNDLTYNGSNLFVEGRLNTGAFTLSLPCTVSWSGAGDVVGNVRRTNLAACPGAAIAFGNPFTTIQFTSPTPPTDVLVNIVLAPPPGFINSVSRTYNITPTGGSGWTAALRLHYLDSELNGNNESTLELFRNNGTNWSPQGVTNRDTTNNWVEFAGVTQFSPWALSSARPTAAPASIGGQVSDANGAPVAGVVMTLTGGAGVRRTITNSQGFYQFPDAETGGFYSVSPRQANYSFAPAERSFSLLANKTDAVFTATAVRPFSNPVDTPEFFVRQHYLDFLGREPDEAGFNFWSDQMLECGNDVGCVERRRINVSAAYFLSIEFQETGGLVDGLYRASYGVRPQFAKFMPDARAVAQDVVVGHEGWQAKLEANKQAFVTAFVNRPAFQAAYDGLSTSGFVDTLINHTGVSFTAGERDALVSSLATGTVTRADVLRSIAENQRFVSAKFNEAFVMMEYFGYLRRDPDESGFQFWLNKLSELNGNFEHAEMVKAFIVSGEYRDRFPR